MILKDRLEVISDMFEFSVGLKIGTGNICLRQTRHHPDLYARQHYPTPRDPRKNTPQRESIVWVIIASRVRRSLDVWKDRSRLPSAN